MRKRARIDANHNELVEAFRKLGCSVLSLAPMGKGCPDLLIGVQGERSAVNLLVEVKDGKKKPSKQRLTPDENDFIRDWRGSLYIVRDLKGAIALVDRARKEMA